MAYEVQLGGLSVRAEVREQENGCFEVVVDDHATVVDARFPEPGVMHLVRDGEAFEVDVRAIEDGHEVTLYGTRYSVQVLDERKKALRGFGGGAGGRGGSESIKTSMPGKVVALLVESGQQVSAGQGVVVVEAMKMENELRATRDGVVGTVAVAEGDAVEGGALLLEIAPLDEA
ncbi:MAG TPA: hypothetical protein DIU15_04345 [Deltaproteobacteria bacterium]|nr:hypothetical protein [Deltaproteobacteria bacterium]HCP45243.1 hypothetical protein [Deltaproteobacteria bacterium]|tara:strand:+ start:673 stop:1194 length:522 start_codon:yes stop_codon:yes gene_type:complete